MPNARVLSEKQAIVAALAEKLQNSQGGVFVDYSGTDVARDTEMRRAMRAAGVDYAVIKNTLTRLAANQVGFEALGKNSDNVSALKEIVKTSKALQGGKQQQTIIMSYVSPKVRTK